MTLHILYIWIEKGSLSDISFVAVAPRSEIKEGICEFRYDGYGRALLSMNKVKVERIEIDNGQGIKTIGIDSDKPFTLVLPENCGIVTIYDINNNTIPITSLLND